VDSHSPDATELTDLSPSADTFLEDVLTGLRQSRKSLPCKYFYDARGSQLFDQICALDEYYLTRTELAILRDSTDAIADAIGLRAMLIEFGSGSSIKTRILLDRLEDPAAYVPVDISRRHLLEAAERLADRYPDLPVLPVSADFTTPFEVPQPDRPVRRRVVFFPGSTIGNFEHADAVELLQHFADVAGEGGGLIIGIILRRINRELHADFDLDQFEHRAVYKQKAGRVEISLVSLKRQTVRVGDEQFEFEAGEDVHTEYSHKYTIAEFAQLAERAGFQLEESWTDGENLFAILNLTVAPAG